jgi:hypothetical protein
MISCKRGLAALFALAILLPACSPLEEYPSITDAHPAATSTVAPVETGAGAGDATCPPAAELGAIPDSVQGMTAGLVPGMIPVWYEDFGCIASGNNWRWGDSNPSLDVLASGGVVTIAARENAGGWDSFLRPVDSLGDGKGMLVLFRYRGEIIANLYIQSGNWQQPEYRRWGLALRSGVSGSAVWEGWEGANMMTEAFPEIGLQPDTWYYLLIQLGDAGQVGMKIWQKEGLAPVAELERDMGSGWQGLAWSSRFQVYRGALELDEYQEFAKE